jgi:hypothetical protein
MAVESEPNLAGLLGQAETELESTRGGGGRKCTVCSAPEEVRAWIYRMREAGHSHNRIANALRNRGVLPIKGTTLRNHWVNHVQSAA